MYIGLLKVLHICRGDGLTLIAILCRCNCRFSATYI